MPGEEMLGVRVLKRLRMRHRRPRFPLDLMWTVIPTDDVRVLASDVEMRVRSKGDVEGVIQTRIRFVLLGVDLAEGMFTAGSGLPGEAQHLRGVFVGVGDVEVPVRPKGKSPQLAQIDLCPGENAYPAPSLAASHRARRRGCCSTL